MASLIKMASFMATKDLSSMCAESLKSCEVPCMDNPASPDMGRGEGGLGDRRDGREGGGAGRPRHIV